MNVGAGVVEQESFFKHFIIFKNVITQMRKVVDLCEPLVTMAKVCVGGWSGGEIFLFSLLCLWVVGLWGSRALHHFPVSVCISS